jgi:hypothetical protein
MKSNIRAGVGLAATFVSCALFLGFAGIAPAQADDWDHYGRDHVYRDIRDVRRDERILHNLQDRRDDARRHHDWDRVHSLDRRIHDLQRHIDHDRRDIRADVDHDHFRR